MAVTRFEQTVNTFVAVENQRNQRLPVAVNMLLPPTRDWLRAVAWPTVVSTISPAASPPASLWGAVRPRAAGKRRVGSADVSATKACSLKSRRIRVQVSGRLATMRAVEDSRMYQKVQLSPNGWVKL
jgi:hypothetical protein